MTLWGGKDHFEALKLSRLPHKSSYPRVTFAPTPNWGRGKCDPTWGRGKCDPRAKIWWLHAIQIPLISVQINHIPAKIPTSLPENYLYFLKSTWSHHGFLTMAPWPRSHLAPLRIIRTEELQDVCCAQRGIWTSQAGKWPFWIHQNCGCGSQSIAFRCLSGLTMVYGRYKYSSWTHGC